MDINFNEMLVDLKSETSGGGTQGLYQDIVEDKILCTGIRPIMDRVNLIEFPKDLVLDIGCNVGSFCHYYNYKGIKEVCGIDKNEKFIKWAKRITPEGDFYCLDLDVENDILGDKKFDTVLFFAVWDYFKNKGKIINFLKVHTGRVLYFEGHADGIKRMKNDVFENGICYKSWESILENELKINYKFFGMTNSERRPFYKCWW